MQYDHATGKVLRALQIVHTKFKNGSYEGMAGTLRGAGIPHDYSKILVDTGIIKRISGGERGVGGYKWVGAKPGAKMALSLKGKYNKLRNSQKILSGKMKQRTLSSINKKMDLILNTVTEIYKLHNNSTKHSLI